MNSDTVLAIAKDHDENMWFGSYKGISRFDGSKWTNYTRDSHAILSDTIKFIAVDKSGSVWIASGYGLSEFNGDNWINYINIEE